MMRLLVYVHGVDGYVNICADRIEKDENFLFAYCENNLVGMFDLGTIMVAYLSEKRSDG